jgi:hypothetical protein
MAEMDLYLYDTPDSAKRKLFGDDLGRWTVSGLFNFQVTKWLGTTFLIQLSSERNFDDDIDLGDKPFYQDRDLYDAKPVQLDFYRFVWIFNFKLR